MLAGVGLMVVCCSSSSAAMMMMGGDGDDAAAGAGAGAGTGAGAGAGTETPEPEPDFFIHETGDRVYGDLLSTGDQTLEQCQALCKANDNCIGISYNEKTKGCWQKGSSGGGGGAKGNLKDYNTPSDYQFHYKNVPGYDVKAAGDRVQGDIEGMPVVKTSLTECSTVCDSKDNCVGFSYKSASDTCYAKKADGLVAGYAVNGFQFYDKKA
tara:strand:- start:42 stop:671 length:630 start_codon:yes stop_codon:yes gene_type:complete